MSASTPIVWTRQASNLWTGRRDGHPVGTIERGSRFRFTDIHGIERGRFRSLLAAQQESECPDGAVPALRYGRRGRALFGIAAGFALLDAGLLTLAVLVLR